MTPGPDLAYKCPNCGKFIARESIGSGNTCGATLYSDGKCIAPMLPEFPYIIKCKKCKVFYWLKDENYMGEYHCGDYLKDEKGEYSWVDRNFIGEYLKDENGKYSFVEKFSDVENLDYAKFLSTKEYIEALDLNAYNDKDDEEFLRIRLWWAFNDKKRKNKKFILKEKDKEIYESNCVKLIELLDKNKVDGKLMCAELYRNLGDYKKCMDILETIDEEDYNWIKELLKKECEKNNKDVIVLTKDD